GHVKVAIAGDGGDEMFGGYPRFHHADVAKRLGRLPGVCLKGIQLASEIARAGAPTAVRAARRMLRAARMRHGGRLVALSCYTFPDELPGILDPGIGERLRDYSPNLSSEPNGPPNPGGPDLVDATIRFALPGDYLRKIDTMSSAHGLEVRVPFLGEHVLACSARIPDDLKYSFRPNKLLLRKLARRYLPRQVAEKPKMGFGIPLDSWLGARGRLEVAHLLRNPRARLRALIAPNYTETLLSGFVA